MKKFFLSLLFFPASLIAQQHFQQGMDDSAFIKLIADNMLINRSAYNNLHYLTKNIGGRLAGSPQMVQAEQWGAKTLKEAGADTVIMQQCMVPHWVRGGKDKATITYTGANGKKQTKEIAALALGNSVGTEAKGIEASIIRVHSFEELEQQKEHIKGKIVFYSVPFEETFIQTFEAYGKNVVYRGSGASQAAKYGAVAVLVRSMTHAVDNNPHTGAMRYNDSFPKIAAAAVGLRDVEWLDTLLDKNSAVTAKLITNAKMLPDTIGHNVIAEWKGATQPEEIITVGGHLDSWDVNEGATDDGAGVVQTIEILRAFKALGFQPKHTIRFVLFANEENGIPTSRGAAKYAEEAKAKNEKHLFALESDAGGFTPRGFSVTASKEIIAKLNSWESLFKPYGVEGFVEGGSDTDIEPLNENFKTPVAGLRPDTQRYFDVHHAAGDVLENVNIRELKLGAINMAALIYLVDKYGL